MKICNYSNVDEAPAVLSALGHASVDNMRVSYLKKKKEPKCQHPGTLCLFNAPN